MAEGFDLGLRNNNCIADGAVLAFGQTGFLAGRGDRCVDDFGMTLGGNDLLRSKHRIADGAFFTGS